jgi:hypothetical protein
VVLAEWPAGGGRSPGSARGNRRRRSGEPAVELRRDSAAALTDLVQHHGGLPEVENALEEREVVEDIEGVVVGPVAASLPGRAQRW